MDATRRLLEKHDLVQRIPDFENFWDNFHRFIDLGHANGRTTADILSESETYMGYDIEAWLSAGSPIDPTPFKLPAPERARFRLQDESARELHAALQSWTDELKGLTKLVTRIQVVWQERQCHFVKAAAAAAAGR